MALPKDVKQREVDRFTDISNGATDKKTAVNIVLWAEDVADTGTYYAVQGQFNASGYFELLTAGSATASVDNILLQSGSNILLQGGDDLLRQTN